MDLVQQPRVAFESSSSSSSDEDSYDYTSKPTLSLSARLQTNPHPPSPCAPTPIPLSASLQSPTATATTGKVAAPEHHFPSTPSSTAAPTEKKEEEASAAFKFVVPLHVATEVRRSTSELLMNPSNPPAVVQDDDANDAMDLEAPIEETPSPSLEFGYDKGYVDSILEDIDLDESQRLYHHALFVTAACQWRERALNSSGSLASRAKKQQQQLTSMDVTPSVSDVTSVDAFAKLDISSGIERLAREIITARRSAPPRPAFQHVRVMRSSNSAH